MRLHTPAQLEELTGLTVGSQRTAAWRSNLENRGQQTAGGHWRFCDEDVLFVSAVRAIGAKGIDLAVASRAASMCLEEILAVLKGEEPAKINGGKPFLFLFDFGDITQECLDAPADSELKAGGKLVYAEQPLTAVLIPLSNLNLIPRISRAGGTVLLPSDVARKIPLRVADLFSGAL